MAPANASTQSLDQQATGTRADHEAGTSPHNASEANHVDVAYAPAMRGADSFVAQANATPRAALMLSMQQTHGNRAVQRYTRHGASQSQGQSTPGMITVQRMTTVYSEDEIKQEQNLSGYDSPIPSVPIGGFPWLDPIAIAGAIAGSVPAYAGGGVTGSAPAASAASTPTNAYGDPYHPYRSVPAPGGSAPPPQQATGGARNEPELSAQEEALIDKAHSDIAKDAEVAKAKEWKAKKEEAAEQKQQDADEDSYKMALITGDGEVSEADLKAGIFPHDDPFERKQKREAHNKREAEEAAEARKKAEREELRRTNPGLALHLDVMDSMAGMQKAAARERRRITEEALGKLGKTINNMPMNKSLTEDLVDVAVDPIGAMSDITGADLPNPRDIVLEHGKSIFSATTDEQGKKGPSNFDKFVDTVQGGISNTAKSVAGKVEDVPILGTLAKSGAATIESYTEIGAGATKGAGDMVSGTLQIAEDPLKFAKGMYTMGENVPLMGLDTVFRGGRALYEGATGEMSGEEALSHVFGEKRRKEQFGIGTDKPGFIENTLGAFADPYKQSYDKGRYGEMVGRAAFDIGGLFLGGGAASKTGKVANAAGKTDELIKVANKLDEATQVASKLDETTQVMSRADETTQVMSRSDEATQVLNRTDDVPLTRTQEIPAVRAERAKNFDDIAGGQAKVGEAPRELRMPDEAQSGMQKAMDESMPSGKPQEQGGVLVENAQGKLEWRPGSPGEATSYNVNYRDVRPGERIVGAGHTHPPVHGGSGQAVGSHVGFSKEDLSRMVYAPENIHFAQSGKGQFATARSEQFNARLAQLDDAGKRAMMEDMNDLWQEIYEHSTGKGLTYQQSIDLATRRVSDQFGLLYYRGEGGVLRMP